MAKSVLNILKNNKKTAFSVFLSLLFFYFGLPFLKEFFAKKTSGFSELNENERDLFMASQSIANALGVTKKWYQISYYNEDEQAVLSIVKRHKRNFGTLERFYYKITKSLLMSDLQQYLSVSEFETLKTSLR